MKLHRERTGPDQLDDDAGDVIVDTTSMETSRAITLNAEKKMRSQSAVDENLNIERTRTARLASAVSGKRTRPISLLCLITSLEMGGAQMMLYKLLAGIDRTQFVPEVISLIDIGPDIGPVGEKIEALGIRVRSLRMRPGIPNPMGIIRLIYWLRRARPDVMQTWMYHADLVGGLAAKLAGGIPTAWGIRQSDLSDHDSRRLTIRTMRVCAHMSKWLPARIVCCSEASQRVHSALGYTTERMMVIPNGFDLRVFKPDAAARDTVRGELQIPADAPIIGLVGRFHPQKDHGNFVEAAALLHRSRPDVYFLLCGDDVTWNNLQLAQRIADAGIAGRCRLLGRRQDVPRLTAALDIAVSSSSFGEGFPNVIGEAMACGVPCAVTDIGDSARIVGDTGRVVPPRRPKELAHALGELVALGPSGRAGLGIAARCRIQEHFDVSYIVTRYQNLYQELALARK